MSAEIAWALRYRPLAWVDEDGSWQREPGTGNRYAYRFGGCLALAVSRLVRSNGAPWFYVHGWADPRAKQAA